MLKGIDRRGVFIAIALIAIVVITSFVAPSSDRQTSGSSFSRSPDGYGAWYAYLERNGGKVQRWQKPADEFVEQKATGRTFIQVNPSFGYSLDSREEAWAKQGNTLIVLGVMKPATEMPFTNVYGTEQGNVKIETSRRQVKLEPGEKAVLSDRAGAIVWERTVGKGRVIYSVTPYLGANAYQDEPGNFAFLAKLARQNGNSIWLDEYLHGYKEKEVLKKEEQVEDWQDYLLKTPFLPILLQLGVLTLVLLWAKNRRFGQPMPLGDRTKDSNATYTQALAGVLRKANRSEFVVDVVGREEQIQIQRALGLGERPVEQEALVQAWVQQTGRPAEELQRVLLTKNRRLSEQDLLTWLNHLQIVRQNLPQT